MHVHLRNLRTRLTSAKRLRLGPERKHDPGQPGRAGTAAISRGSGAAVCFLDRHVFFALTPRGAAAGKPPGARPVPVIMPHWTRTPFVLALLLPLCAACQAASPAVGRIPDGSLPQQGVPASPAAGRIPDGSLPQQGVPAAPARAYAKPSPTELRQKLSPLQFEVTQHEATEPPFRNEHWNNHEPGIYVDIATGEPLFSSLDKFDSGTGWPSFLRPIEDGHVVSKSDDTLGMDRTEVRSSGGDSHLGHVFDDGPAPTGLRFCINSASLRFVPLSRLGEEGYGAYAARFGDRAATPAPASTAHADAR
jgi:methionine-R-sulfoxide reductase